jgi:hypothetical protein
MRATLQQGSSRIKCAPVFAICNRQRSRLRLAHLNYRSRCRGPVAIYAQVLPVLRPFTSRGISRAVTAALLGNGRRQLYFLYSVHGGLNDTVASPSEEVTG